MNYIYDYTYLIDILSKYYKTKDLNKIEYLYSKDLHISIYRIKRILNSKLNYFTQNEITNSINLLKLNNIQIRKCFFNYIKETRYKKDLK